MSKIATRGQWTKYNKMQQNLVKASIGGRLAARTFNCMPPPVVQVNESIPDTRALHFDEAGSLLPVRKTA